MKNTIIKRIIGYAAASIILGTLAIGTVFAAGRGKDILKNKDSGKSAVEAAADDNSLVAVYRPVNSSNKK